MTEQDVGNIKNKIHEKLAQIERLFLKTSNNNDYAIKQLNGRLKYLEWMHTKYKLRAENPPSVIKQREIFYCRLGLNIGSEQNFKRPVVILQNNIGNRLGNTTIIAPMTSYNNSDFYKKESDNNSIWVKYTDNNNQTIDRPLDFYEIPIETDKGSKYQISGIINVVHIREISIKRLFKTPVATITEDNFREVIAAINHNLSIL